MKARTLLNSFFLAILLSFFSLTASAQPEIAEPEMKGCGTAVIGRKHMTASAAEARQKQKARRKAYSGERRGLIILVDFPDVPFLDGNVLQTWTDIVNKSGYADNGAMGSVSDYFYDQSYGQFRLMFDVVGPVTAAQDHDYYGDNIDWGDPTGWFDQNVGELVEEACRGVSDKVSFADYDWDGDGEVEEVYILYAGHGENDYWNRDSTVIWPHMATLMYDWEGYEEGLMLQGVRINTYACSNEINRSGSLAGMGTFCHEFSHCLGLPDMYNTEDGSSVLGRYDLMDQGNYNGNSWCPVGYSSYERYSSGWLEPVPVDDVKSITIAPENLTRDLMTAFIRPLHEYPDAFIYHTSEDASDYYLIEYRKKESWDTYIPRAGLLAWHIDYDEQAWEENTVNNDPYHLRVEHMTVDIVPSGISDVILGSQSSTAIYDLRGNIISPFMFSPLPHGIYIVRMSDGTTKKCIR